MPKMCGKVLWNLLQSLMAPVRTTSTFWSKLAQHQLFHSSKFLLCYSSLDGAFSTASLFHILCLVTSFQYWYKSCSKNNFWHKTRDASIIPRLVSQILPTTKLFIQFLPQYSLPYAGPTEVLKVLLLFYWERQTTKWVCKKQKFTVINHSHKQS